MERPDQSPLELQFLKEEAVEVCPEFGKYQSTIIERENFYWKKLKLPDGKQVLMKKEVYEIPESLFSPSDFGLGGQGLPQRLFSSIKVSSEEHSVRSANWTDEQNGLRRRKQQSQRVSRPGCPRIREVMEEQPEHSRQISAAVD